jgi:type I restriction enzyme S subunit
MRNNMKITAKQEQATPVLVPKLRFPEFRGADGWEADALGVVANFVSEKVPLERVALENYISTENILPDYGGIAKASKLPTAGAVTRYRPNDTLVSNIRPYLKKVWVADKEGGASNDVIVIRAKQNLLPQYFSCLLKNDAFIDYVMTGAKGVKMPRGDVGSMKAYRTLYPSKAEQQKIAECLSSVDELIAAQARKVAALKTHKKGLMQQLFPREGETRPRLRFPEFQDAGEWDDAPMGTLLMSSPDYGVNAAAVPFSDQLPKYLRITDISADGRYLPEKQVSVNLEATDWNYLDEGDIVLARTGASVGKSYQYRKEDGRLVFAGFLIRVKPHPKKLVSSFLANFLVTGKFWKWVAVNSARSGQPGINSTEYSSLTIPLPPTLREQHRLATCLSSLDTLITAETQKLETLKTHKKGLMQQLFPSLDEVKS